MQQSLALISLLAFSAALSAQDAASVPTAKADAEKHELRIGKTEGLRWEIQSSSKTSSQTRMWINGEERQGRGGAGPRTNERSQKVVFDELGPGEDGVWRRKYVTAQASTTRPGRDGENQTREVKGAIAGKELHLFETEQGLSARVAGAKGDDAELSPMLVGGMPLRFDVAALLPKKAVGVGDSWELDKSFLESLRKLQHRFARTGLSACRVAGASSRVVASVLREAKAAKGGSVPKVGSVPKGGSVPKVARAASVPSAGKARIRATASAACRTCAAA
jgi:hypothetical protein